MQKSFEFYNYKKVWCKDPTKSAHIDGGIYIMKIAKCGGNGGG